MRKKYLELYYKWIENGELPYNGLCNCFGNYNEEDECEPDGTYVDFEMMLPSPHDDTNPSCGNYWGAGECVSRYHRAFTPLRQNIVLFLAALNDEL